MGVNRAGPAASSVLPRLCDAAPPGRVDLNWLLGRLGGGAFGIVMLMLSLAAIVPGVAVAAGLLLTIPAAQMVLGHATPTFPCRIATMPFRARRIARLARRAIPVLTALESLTHPRWGGALRASARLTGAVVVMLSATLILIPIPLTNLVPASSIALICLALVEKDGLLPLAALAAGIATLLLAAVTAAASIHVFQ